MRAAILRNTSHPPGLGSALTNRFITTDFSEALLEFVTPALESTWEALQAICDIHQFTYQQLGDELLWAASMPCRTPEDTEIPLAYYGESNVGQMKTVYRRGLGHRYGRPMQTIAGVHFNYSLPESFWPAYRESSRLYVRRCRSSLRTLPGAGAQFSTLRLVGSVPVRGVARVVQIVWWCRCAAHADVE